MQNSKYARVNLDTEDFHLFFLMAITQLVKRSKILAEQSYPGIYSWVQSWVSCVEPGLPRKSSS